MTSIPHTNDIASRLHHEIFGGHTQNGFQEEGDYYVAEIKEAAVLGVVGVLNRYYQRFYNPQEFLALSDKTNPRKILIDKAPFEEHSDLLEAMTRTMGKVIPGRIENAPTSLHDRMRSIQTSVRSAGL